MPNWVTNKIYMDVDPDHMHDILNAIKHDDGKFGSFDFNKLIPMPESLNLTKGSITDIAISARLYQLTNMGPEHFPEYLKSMAAALDYKKKHFGFGVDVAMSQEKLKEEAERMRKTEEELFDLGRQYLDNQMKYGATTWYDWAIDHWGTKWNCSPEDSILDPDEPSLLRFDTAWSAPAPIVEALSKRFPDISITHEWADEDMGQNVGRIIYLNGEEIDSYIPVSGSKDAYDLYFEITDSCPEDNFLRYDEESGSYIYDEEMEARAYAQSRTLNEMIAAAENKREEQDTGPDITPEKEPER